MQCTEEMYQAFKATVYSKSAENETVADATKNGIEAAIEVSTLPAQIEAKDAQLAMAVKLFDQILPQLGKVCIDVGLLNEFLMQARKPV